MQKPFTPNNHSKYKIEWKEVEHGVKEALEEIILKNYSFHEIGSIAQVKEWECMSNNFKVKVKEENDWKEILLRRHIQIKDEKSISMISRISDFLSDNGVKTPKIIKTAGGERFLKAKGDFYQVFEFVQGNHYNGSESELRESAKNLALLHKTLEKIPFKKEIASQTPLIYPWTISGWKKIFEYAESKKTKEDKILLENKSYILGLAESISKNLAAMNETRKQPIHCDLHPQNTIFYKDKLAAILDFEGVRIDSLARDASNACHRFARQFAVYQQKDWHETLPKGVRIFMEEYCRVNPLTEKEKKMASLFIEDEILRKLYKDLSIYYSQDCSKNIQSGELEKKLTLLREAPIIGELIQKT